MDARLRAAWLNPVKKPGCVRIELLRFEDCPNSAPALERIQTVLQSEGIDATVVAIEVDTPDEAQRLRFLGSPSIRVNGVDIEPEARGRTDFGLMCRTYRDGETVTGLPPIALLSHAVRAARLRDE